MEKKSKSPIILILLIMAAVAAYGLWVSVVNDSQPESIERENGENASLSQPVTLGERYVLAYYEAPLEGAQTLEEPPEITGDTDADARIRELAQQRGYQLQPIATSELVEVEGAYLQPDAARSWDELQAAADEDGVELHLRRGHISIEEQRETFLEELRRRGTNRIGREYTSAQIAGGTADVIINAILREYPIPGYAKHHSGYVLDIIGAEGIEDYEGSQAEVWLRENEYKNAAEFGFLPSYPGDGPVQGPEPRPWEFAWVGADAIPTE